jgi:hypothetical protein
MGNFGKSWEIAIAEIAEIAKRRKEMHLLPLRSLRSLCSLRRIFDPRGSRALYLFRRAARL